MHHMLMYSIQVFLDFFFFCGRVGVEALHSDVSVVGSENNCDEAALCFRPFSLGNRSDEQRPLKLILKVFSYKEQQHNLFCLE
jgi:hypothetical protein